MSDLYYVGVGQMDITPSLEQPVFIAGFAANRTALSVLHPLVAQAVYLKDAQGSAVCFVTLDLIGFLQPEVERLRNRVSHLVDRERLVVCSTHTHSGPDTLGLWGKAALGIPYRSGVDPEYLAWVGRQAAAAVTDAVADAEPARVAATTFDIPRGMVRNDRKGGGTYRKTVALAARTAGGTKTVMLNFAAHPEALWEKNRQLSPDYPGPYRNWMARLGVPHAPFFSGPIGAMLTPDVAPSADTPERVRYVEQFGRMLALTTMEKLEGATGLEGPVQAASRKLPLTNANKGFELARKLGVLNRPIEDGVIHTEVTVGRIGDFAFTTVPGEPSPEVGRELHEALGARHGMILALGQDELGYIIPTPFFDDKEYKYEQSMSVGPHTAPTVVSTTKELIGRLPNE